MCQYHFLFCEDSEGISPSLKTNKQSQLFLHAKEKETFLMSEDFLFNQLLAHSQLCLLEKRYCNYMTDKRIVFMFSSYL